MLFIWFQTVNSNKKCSVPKAKPGARVLEIVVLQGIWEMRRESIKRKRAKQRREKREEMQKYGKNVR